MISGCMVITKPKGDQFCGVAENTMRYVLARGHVILGNGWFGKHDHKTDVMPIDGLREWQ